MKLFPKDKVAGIFRGFSEGGLEFHADLVLPYKEYFQSTPMHGHFLIVQLEHEDEAVLGRITSISAQGRLASGAGEDYGIRAVNEGRIVDEALREQYLKYQVNIRVLGVLCMVADKLEFAPSHRRLPHVGSKKVAGRRSSVTASPGRGRRRRGSSCHRSDPSEPKPLEPQNQGHARHRPRHHRQGHRGALLARCAHGVVGPARLPDQGPHAPHPGVHRPGR